MSDTADFGTFGRFAETPVDGMSPQMKDAYQYRGKAGARPQRWAILSTTGLPVGSAYKTPSRRKCRAVPSTCDTSTHQMLCRISPR